MTFLRIFAVLAAILIGAGPVVAQDKPPALLADRIDYSKSEDALIATGNVTFLHQGRRLRAQKVTFYNADGRLLIEGDILITEVDGSQIRADLADLDTELTEGLIFGARLLLADNFQFSAVEARRGKDGTTTLYKAVGSACQVCANQPVPLWLIRADRVMRDENDLQIHFQGAKFDVMGVTVGYLPYFRMADPSVDRATGFLNPKFRRSDLFGFGLSLPYYIVIADDSDATITPFVTTTGASIIGGEYRKRFASGQIDITGSLAVNDGDGAVLERAHIFATGKFALRDDFTLNFEAANVTDKGYLGQFGFSDTDRLQTSATLSRQRARDYIEISGIGFQTLREGENDKKTPFVLPEAIYSGYWDFGGTGGQLGIEANLAGLVRAEGRDVLKASASATWRRQFSLANGVIGTTIAAADGRLYLTADDPNFDTGPEALLVPLLGVDMRWPLARRSDGVTHVIEPIAQVVYSEVHGNYGSIPNEDSLQVEFDAANLFALNRYPGTDRIEQGGRMNLGINYTRIDDDGWQIGTTVGQVFREGPQQGFPDNTGLNGISSNIVAAANLDLPPFFSLSNQTLFDRQFSFARNDIQASLRFDRFELDGSYVFLAADPPAGAAIDRREFAFTSRYAFGDNWVLDTQWRRDLLNGRNVFAEAGLEFQNECLKTRFSASRRFTNSGRLPASTEFGLSVVLAGLGGSGEGSARKCIQY